MRFKQRTTGFSWAREELLGFHIPRPGYYVLSMTGLGSPQESDAACAVAFTRPHWGQLVAHILGIIMMFGIFITSLVFFLLLLFEK